MYRVSPVITSIVLHDSQYMRTCLILFIPLYNSVLIEGGIQLSRRYTLFYPMPTSDYIVLICCDVIYYVVDVEMAR